MDTWDGIMDISRQLNREISLLNLTATEKKVIQEPRIVSIFANDLEKVKNYKQIWYWHFMEKICDVTGCNQKSFQTVPFNSLIIFFSSELIL